MVGSENYFRQTLVNLDANSKKAVTELSQDFRFKNDNKACNYLFIINEADNKVYAELNENSNERYPVSSKGGTLVIDVNDLILFQSLNIVEENGNAVTGNIKVVGGVL